MIHTENVITIDAPPDRVYALACDISSWPKLLSHYRYVRQVDSFRRSPFASGPVYAMGALRSFIPIRWTSIQERDANNLHVLYHHVAGATAGMDVRWSIQSTHGGTLARIDHDLVPKKLWLRSPVSRYILGRLFVQHVAQRTLEGIKRQAESPAKQGAVA